MKGGRKMASIFLIELGVGVVYIAGCAVAGFLSR